MIKNRLCFKNFCSFFHKSFLVLLLISTSVSTSYAEIIPTYSINSITIKNLLPQIGKASLVLINIDDTIITPKSKMFSYRSPYKGFISELNATNKYNSTADQIIVNLILNRQVVLVEEDWPNFINKLEEKGAFVFGFTKIEPILRRVEDFKQRQYQQFSKLGIQFTNKFNNKDIFNFDETDKNSPTFYHGIIFTDILSNAVAVRDFINIMNHFPFDNIIVFSNEKSELMEISNAFGGMEVNYYGIEYLAVTEKNETPNAEVVKFQQNRLLQTGEWLEDEVVKELIKNNESVK